MDSFHPLIILGGVLSVVGAAMAALVIFWIEPEAQSYRASCEAQGGTVLSSRSMKACIRNDAVIFK